jgi:hypothetical protein
MDYEKNIGKRVCKCSITRQVPNNKPFKSRLKINTIKGVINHPKLNKPAYIFEEDDSYVECRGCIIIDSNTLYQEKIIDFLKQQKTLIITAEQQIGKAK